MGKMSIGIYVKTKDIFVIKGIYVLIEKVCLREDTKYQDY